MTYHYTPSAVSKRRASRRFHRRMVHWHNMEIYRQKKEAGLALLLDASLIIFLCIALVRFANFVNSIA